MGCVADGVDAIIGYGLDAVAAAWGLQLQLQLQLLHWRQWYDDVDVFFRVLTVTPAEALCGVMGRAWGTRKPEALGSGVTGITRPDMMCCCVQLHARLYGRG
jgi:hypothetical protein